MSDLSELFAELKAEIGERRKPGTVSYNLAIGALYDLDEDINNGEFARAEQDAYIG